MTTLLYRIGRFSARRPWTVIGAWMLLAVVVVTSAAAFGRELEDSMRVPGLDSQEATDLLSEAGSDRAGLSARIVATPDDGERFADAPVARSQLDDVRAAVAALDDVVGTATPVVSADGRVAIVDVRYPVMEEVSVETLRELERTIEESRTEGALQIEVGGELVFAFDEAEQGLGEMIGIVAAMVILLFAFGSVIAMGLPIGIALFGLALGIGSMGLVTYLIEIPSWVPDIATMVGLGVGIDYALFLVTRHREFVGQGMTIVESAARAVATAGQAVVFAGGTVVIAILGLAVAGVPFMTAAGVATSITVCIMVAAAITLLPAFLGVCGHWIDRIGLHRRGVTASAAGSGWTRWVSHVTRNAWSYAIGVTAVLLALSAPVLSLRLGFPDDGTKPETQSERRAYDLVAEGFGPGVNGPLLIAVDLDANGDGTIADDAERRVEGLATSLAADVGVAAVVDTSIDPSSGVATIVAHPTTAPQDAATFETVERLRSDVIPSELSGSDLTAHVGGATASFGDIANRVSDRLPVFVVAVVGLSFVLLMLVFRSVLVPLKAALLNLLSIGAAYGVLVAVFQWGWGKDLIGLESTVPIVSFVPMFMFAIVFGLSMDYEVFLLSRVREEYVATGDNDASVVHGLSSTARVITSAALIMIAVFGGFVLGDDPTVKMFGLGLATAIFVDATIVRVVLVPATMTLMGDANWWLPRWLARRLPTVEIDGENGLPEPEMQDTVVDPGSSVIDDARPVLVR